MKVFVDTSAFYALTSDTDRAHREARVIQEQLKQLPPTLVTTNYVFLETFSLLQRRHGLEAAERFGNSLPHYVEIVWIDASTHQAAWEHWQHTRQRGLSFVDCSCFVVMRTLGIHRAFAFDSQFQAAGFTLLKSTFPPEMVGEARGVYRVGRRKRTH